MGMAFGRELAAYLNATAPQEIVPIFNTGFGVNSIAQSLPLRAGDNIAFCEVEFPSNAYPWMSLERDGIEIRQVPAVNGGLTLDSLETRVDGRTKLVAASAVQFFTGHRTDLVAIGGFCRERGILFFVDAIQSIGHMKFDVQSMNIDMLASGGQKSIMAPPGIGFMYVRDEVVETLSPRMIGCDSTRNYEHWMNYDTTPLPGAARFKAGTPNISGMFGLLESLSLIKELGPENIDRHTAQLVDTSIEMLTRLGYEVITDRREHGPIVTFKTGMSEKETDALIEHLASKMVSVVKHLSSDGVPHLRLSFHCYNKEEEVHRFEAIIKDFCL